MLANTRTAVLVLAGLLGCEPFSEGLLLGQARQEFFYFPLVASGRSGDIAFRTELLVANPDGDATIRLDAYDRSGRPWGFEFAQGSFFIHEAFLRRGQVFEGSGNPPEELGAGYVVVTVRASSDASGLSPSGIAVLSRYDGEPGSLTTQVGVPAPQLVSEFTVLLDSRGAQDTGLAIVNPWSSSATAHLHVTVWDNDFEQIVATADLTLPLGSAMSRFIWEMFEDGSNPDLVAQLQEMRGVVTVVSDQRVAALTLRQTDDPAIGFPEEVPVLTVFPVMPGRGDSAEVAPVPEADRLSVQLAGRHYDVFHSEGDAVDLDRQDAFFDWLTLQFGFSAPGRIQFFKYRDRQHMKRMTGLELTGFAPGYSLNLHSVKPLDTHETVHLFTDSALGVAIPFLIEGLAVAYSIDDPLSPAPRPVWGDRHIHEVARQIVLGNDLPSLDSMLDAFGWLGLTSNGNSYPAYPVAGSFVRFLIDEHQMADLVQFFRESWVLDPVTETEAKFAAAFGVSLSDEWSRWQDFVRTFP